MNLRNMMNSLLKLGSSISKNNGRSIFKEGLVNKVISKKIDNTYHIYGRVIDNKNEFSTHIKFDLKDKVKAVKCTCNQFEENSREINNYICAHIVATMYKFYYEAYTKIQKQKIINNNSNNINKNNDNCNSNDNKFINNINKPLNLDIKLKQIKVNNKNEYYLELRAGKEGTIAVESLGKFLFEEDNKFKYKDYLIIDFLRKKLKADRSRITNARSFKLYDNELKELLNLIDNKKEIQLNYDYMNYTSVIHKEDIPLIFTIKKKGEAIIVKPQKKSIIPLNSDRDIWLYEKKIYLPSEKQLKYYKPLYEKLREKDTLVYKDTYNNLKKIVFILGEISRDIIIDESIKEQINKINMPKFYISKEGSNIYCTLKIEYINSLDGIKDAKAIEKLEMTLERYRFIKKDERFIFIGDEEETYTLLKEGIEYLNKIGKVSLSKEFKDMNLIDSSSIFSFLREENESFYFQYKVEGLEYRKIPEVLNEIRKGSNFYRTKKNSFLDLQDEKVVGFFRGIEELNLFNNVYKEEIYVDKFNLLHLQNNIKNKKLPFISGEEKINILLEKLKNKDREYIVPENLNANLREYQRIGYNWLRTIEELGFGGILADDMGLGKTIQTITLLLSKPGKKSLIVTPTSVLYNWKNEFGKFAEGLKIGIIHGGLKERSKILDSYKEYDVLLTTYGTLRRDLKLYEDKSFDFCIIDEGQNIKNKASKISEAVKSIKANTKIALTGTPIENNLLELWSIFDFIMPMYLFSVEKFKEKFMKGNDEDLKELKELISPFILRRLKEEVLDELPEKIEKEYIIPMSTKQRQVYNSYMREVKKKLKENKDNKILIFSFLTKLRQLCLDPSLLIEDFKEESSKIKAIEEIVEEALEGNKKIIIFSQFTSALNKIGNKLKTNNIKYLYLDGSINAKERLRLAEEFNEGNTNIFLISLKAGGVGLNLTSANIVVHFDPWWNPAVENQATDRAYRIGQKNIVEVIKLISKDTIEEKIIKLQEEKKELISKVIDGNMLTGDKLNSITEEELLNLFS
ncbi:MULTISPECIES: DEAD/DEAH box helicase [unclassified Clostridium]|uniref:DEAD/DEAH box helicase n=1 Tax=unclassified Clostridium TaxID=2614128 RepID=UPI002A7F2B98|nr:DEAD/DEAH box helicase [Clostridium sp.]MCI6693059.1 DEAD/DEAH box helicase [Clostridium sp.]MDY4253827.1 DEAD/DEAH box helicase [Clostridium sp.]